MSGVRRRWVSSLLAPLVLLGCARVVPGHVTGAAGTHPSAAGSGGTPVATASTPAATAKVLSRDQLYAHLMPAPAESHAMDGSWDQTPFPSAPRFAEQYYDPSYVATVVSTLTAEGLKVIAHRTWAMPDHDLADVILLGFDSAAGAQSRTGLSNQALLSDDNMLPLSTPGTFRVATYLDNRKDRYGYVHSYSYGSDGTVAMEILGSYSDGFQETEIARWVRTQTALLG